jgi:putative molybdopterin biosynthesis protein
LINFHFELNALGHIKMAKRNIFIDNMDLDDARKLWHQKLTDEGCLQPMQAETITVDESLGRITAEPVFASLSSPFYNASAMDGIAVRFKDTIGASETSPIRLSQKSMFEYVNTGNALPDKFDAVIMIEDVQPIDDETVEIINPVTPWKHVRTIGEDIVSTELILPDGHRIRPIDLGAMLATGLTSVKVRKKPTAIVIPTGSELVQPGAPLKPGSIIEFNSRVLAGYLQEWGIATDRSPIVSDSIESLKKSIKEASDTYDFVVINAGASAGTKDYTAHIIAELGEVVLHGVNIKPGKPVILGIINGKPVIGLPGYTVSAVITMRLFIKSLVEALLGTELTPTTFLEAILSRPLSSRLGAEEFIRVKLGRVGKSLMATPTARGAGAVMSLVQADGFLTVSANSEGVGAGERVDIELLRDEHEIENTLVFIGSHDNILDVLANLLHRLRPICRLSSAHVGSMGGILAIKRGEAHLAGTHLLDEETGDYNISFIKKYIPNTPLQLINLAYREQGLLVPRGNPLGIAGFEDLTRDDVRFINRQRGAGTRLLTDMHLKRLNIEPDQITGYNREEYTHMNVASAITSNNADTGLAIRAAAVALNLDFIPVAQERYDLILPKAHLDDPKVQALLETIGSNKEFRQTVEGLGGYDLRDCGTIMYEQ